MKIEGVSIQPDRPLSFCNCRLGSSLNPLVPRLLYDQRLRSAFVGITGEDWELKHLKDLASLYELNPKDRSVFVEASLTSQLIDRLSTSVTLEDRDAQIPRLRGLLLKLEEDGADRECFCV
jgi:hypothetical protein